MSTLSAETSIRFRTTTTAYLQTQTIQTTHALTWTTTHDGIWTAQLHDTTAGTVHRTDTGFQVHDWQDTVESIHPTLAAAQLSLEPAIRTTARTTTAAIQHRAGLLASSTIITAALSIAGIITTITTIHPM